MKQHMMATRTLLLGTLVLLTALLLVGCGGGDSSSALKTQTGASFKIKWPARTRVVPRAAESITVTVTGGATPMSQTVDRPAGDNAESSLSFPQLASNVDLIFTASAYDNPGGTGTLLATGTATQKIPLGRFPTIVVVMDSTITTVSLAPLDPTIAVDETVNLGLSAHDATDALVLVHPVAITWESSDEAIATVDDNGVVTGMADGTAEITATDTESHLSARTTVTVGGTPPARETYSLVAGWGSMGSGPTQFRDPLGVELDKDGNICVADNVNKRIARFDLAGNPLTPIRTESMTIYPSDVAIAADGSYFVVDHQSATVTKFSSAGTFVDVIASYADPIGDSYYIAYPTSIAIGPDGNLYIVDMYQRYVYVLKQDGTFVRAWGSDDVMSDFGRPYAITVDKNGLVYVTDTWTNTVLVYTNTGRLIREWGSKDLATDELYGPMAIAVDQDGNVYVCDTYHNRVRKYDSYGNFITNIGATDAASPAYLDNPRGIAIAPTGEVVVSCFHGYNLRVFTKD